MLEALKKMDRKFLLTCGILIVVPLLIIILLMILRGCDGQIGSYDKYQNSMIKNAEKYFQYHKLLPNKDGKEAIVSLEELENDGLKSASSALKDDSCTGSVTVRNNGGNYLYIPYLECKDYKTTYLIDKLKKQVVNKESGLYKFEDGYIFKGNKVNNYVMFNNAMYRIISINENNDIRMIKTNSENTQISWDTKYNVSEEDSVGINDFYNSEMYDTLWRSYNDKKQFSSEIKKHLVSQSVCLDKKSESDLNINNYQCNNYLKGQYITIPTIYDYEKASYDANCTQIGSGSCSNFNYLSDVISTSWTINASSDDTHSVYFISGSYIDTMPAKNYAAYHWVISISGKEIVSEGNGTLEKPFVIK